MYITELLVHPPYDSPDLVVERFPDSLLSYWYILSCVGTMPLVSHLNTWYLLSDKTIIVVPLFQIANAILEVQNSIPHFIITCVSF